MSKAIQILNFEEQAVGRTIKSSKKRFTWKFILDSISYTIDLHSSKFSGKRSIKINGEIHFQGKKTGKLFHQTIEIGSHSLIIIEVNKSYDLRIDGTSFNLLKKQETFEAPIHNIEKTQTTSKLVSESQEDWEKSAKPYDVIIREGLITTIIEKLPIIPKKTKNRQSAKPTYDGKYMFGTSNPGLSKGNSLGVEEIPKPRTYSSYSPVVTGNSTHSNPFL
ncbi:hypothetical protein SteCoe_33369 [Stentor coeruleus]|uniref:Uncharacterized protein n=1 Tax=Stentor coeruleus TaxID=5963 RepID=A0A1R2AWY4_9CILI|nr:hypothetical protein SteCoe_33369 [Stentor coeruleus]